MLRTQKDKTKNDKTGCTTYRQTLSSGAQLGVGAGVDATVVGVTPLAGGVDGAGVPAGTPCWAISLIIVLSKLYPS